jgi:hypothetical protein
MVIGAPAKLTSSGLAFAVGGYASFWLIAAMCVLTALVGINYIIICGLYPDGGGVYASVRHRSEVISIVGGFLLIADYLVTAAISALSAFQYLGVPNPELFAAAAILAIGLLNLLGPKHTGGLALLIAVPTMLVVIVLGVFCLPHLGAAVRQIQPLQGGFLQNWQSFVGIVLALSGVEAIANATGVMRLDSGKHGVSSLGAKDLHTRHSLGDGRSLPVHRFVRIGGTRPRRSPSGQRRCQRAGRAWRARLHASATWVRSLWAARSESRLATLALSWSASSLG